MSEESDESEGEEGEESEHEELPDIEKTTSKKRPLSVDPPLGSKKQKTLGEQSSTNTKPSNKFKGDQVAPEISAFFLKKTPSVGPTSDVPVGPPENEETLCLNETEGRVYGADVDIIHMAGAPGFDYPADCHSILQESITNAMLEAKVPQDILVNKFADAVSSTGVEWSEEKANDCAWIIDCINRGKTAAILAERVGFGKV